MYKWQLQSALSRGRPATGSISRVADGIASTLRAFSISARQCEDATQPTRAERSQTASQEISSLRQGVDARSLAAKAPAAPKFAVRRVDRSPREGSVSGGRGGFRGRGGPAARGFRGRGGARGGARGGLQGRGGRGGKPKPRRRGGARNQVDDDQDIPLTREEKKYWHEKTYGLPQVYEAGSKTTEEALRRTGPALALNKDGLRGLQQTVQDRMNISAGRLGDQYVTQEELIRRYAAGRAIVFANEEEKQKVMGYWTARRQLTSEASGLEYKPPVFNGLNDMEKAAILQSLTAGQYQALKDIGKGDALAGIEVYTQKNETYTLTDGAQLMDKIKALLPVSKPVAAAKSPSPASKPAAKK